MPKCVTRIVKEKRYSSKSTLSYADDETDDGTAKISMHLNSIENT